MIKVYCDMADADIDRGIIEERLVAYETFAILKAIRENNDFESLTYMLGNGITGFYKMSDEDLLMEWSESQEGFYKMMETDGLPFDLLDDDPLMGRLC